MNTSVHGGCATLSLPASNKGRGVMRRYFAVTSSGEFMRSMHTVVLSICLTSLSLASAQAVDATRRAKAAQMLEVTETDGMMKEQMAGLEARINGMAKEQAGGPNMTAQQTKLMNDYLKQVSTITDGEISWEKLRPLVVDKYAAEFTDEQLDAIIAFYKSPAGKALVEKTPAMAQQTMTMVQERIKLVQPQLIAVTKTYEEQMKAATPAPAAATPAASMKPKAPAAPTSVKK